LPPARTRPGRQLASTRAPSELADPSELASMGTSGFGILHRNTLVLTTNLMRLDLTNPRWRQRNPPAKKPWWRWVRRLRTPREPTQDRDLYLRLNLQTTYPVGGV